MVARRRGGVARTSFCTARYTPLKKRGPLMHFILSAVLQTTILIPTLYNGPGAFGSRWWSAVVINNHSDVAFSSPGVQFGIECPIPEGCQSTSVPPGQFGVVGGPAAANGLLLHGDPAVLASLAFHGRFGQGTNYLTNGTEIPIVRETQFVRGPIHFPYVTLYDTPQAERATLRIY